MPALQNLIAEHQFAHGLTLQHLGILAKGAVLEHYRAQQVIFREGGQAHVFYLIHQGAVSLEAFVAGKGTITIETVGVGDSLGWSWLFAPYQWHFTATATAPTELIGFEADHLRRQIEANADFGREILWRVSSLLLRRLLATRAQLLAFYGVHD
jgi:CRP-like cAMP-binding protein